MRKATTVRLDPAVQAGLYTLGKALHRPLNQLVNEALKEFVARRSQEVEADLEATLEELRAVRSRDPDFERATAAFVEAEATGGLDPAEGRVAFEGGPARTRLREILNG